MDSKRIRTPIPIGEIINLPRLRFLRKPKLLFKKVRVSCPSRLTPMVIDPSKLGFSSRNHIPSGGSIGFGISLRSFCQIEANGKVGITASGRRNIALHYGSIMQKILKANHGLNILAEDHGIRHMGAGSTSATAIAVLHAVNIAFNCPLSRHDLIKIASYNYVEEDDNLLYPGISLGTGAAIGTYGGHIVIGNDCEIIIRKAIPSQYRIALGFFQGHAFSVADEFELAEYLKKENSNDSGLQNNARYQDVLMEYLPAMRSNCYNRMGELILKWQFSSPGKRILRGMEALEIMSSLRNEANVEITAISSMGPIIFSIFSRKKEEEVKNLLQRHGIEKIMYLQPDNKGMVVECACN